MQTDPIHFVWLSWNLSKSDIPRSATSINVIARGNMFVSKLINVFVLKDKITVYCRPKPTIAAVKIIFVLEGFYRSENNFV